MKTAGDDRDLILSPLEGEKEFYGTALPCNPIVMLFVAPGGSKMATPVGAVEAAVGDLPAARRCVQDALPACIYGDMGNIAAIDAEKHQVARAQAAGRDAPGLPVLLARGPRYGDAGLAVGVIDQPAAVEAAGCGAAVAIRPAEHPGSLCQAVVPVVCIDAFGNR